MIKKNLKTDTDFIRLIDNLNSTNKVRSPNTEIVKNIRLIYNLLAKNLIDYKEAIGMISEFIGLYSKGDYPSMRFSNSSKTKRKSRGKT